MDSTDVVRVQRICGLVLQEEPTEPYKLAIIRIASDIYPDPDPIMRILDRAGYNKVAQLCVAAINKNCSGEKFPMLDVVEEISGKARVRMLIAHTRRTIHLRWRAQEGIF